MSILIKDALIIVTMNDKREKIEHGDIYIEGNKIKQIGTGLHVKPERTIDARNKVVLPGFINTHHHLYQTLFRNLPDVQDAELFDWLLFLYELWKNMDPEAVYISAKLGISELLLTGCTTTVDHYYIFPKNQPGDLIDHEIRAAQELGIRFHPSRGSMSRGRSKGGLPPDEVVQPEDEILKDAERLINTYHDPGPFSMCRIVLAPCSPFSVTTELLKETVRFARSRGIWCKTHLAETKDEEEFCLNAVGKRPVEYMEELDWLGEDIWFVHAVHLNEDEIKVLGSSRTGVTHCPTSNLRLGSGIAPVRKMLDSGVPVSLGVDGSSSNDSSSMLAELRQCLLVHRVKSGIKSMPAEDVLWMATRGGAKVIGREDIGSLEEGKAADLILIDLNKIAYAGSMADPVASLVFCGDSHIIDMGIVNGRIRVEGGRLVGVDEDKLIREANRISKELREKR